MVLSLDLSINSTGYALFDNDGQMIDYGIIKAESPSGSYKWRYPLKSVRKCQSAAMQVLSLIKSYINDLDAIIIEEINLNTKKNMISFKTLAALQFLIMAELTNDQIQIIDIIKCSEWRSALRMKKADSIHGWKGASVDRVNQTYGTNFELSDNDIADAINIYDGWKIRNNK